MKLLSGVLLLKHALFKHLAHDNVVRIENVPSDTHHEPFTVFLVR